MSQLDRVSAAVQLTGASLANPLIAVADVVQDANTDIFSNALIGAPWNAAPYDVVFNGIIPDIFGREYPFPILNSVVSNVSGYTWAGIRGSGEVGLGLALGLTNTPGALINAVQILVGGGSVSDALAVLQTAIVDPIQTGIASGVEAATYIVDNLVQNVQIVAAAIPQLVTSLVTEGIAGAQYVIGNAITTLKTAFAELTSGDLTGAWNTSVNGFLGRNGTLGYIENLTLGPGINDTTVPVTIPSARTILTTGAQTVGDNIFNPPYTPVIPVPSAAKKPAASASALAAVPTATGTSAGGQSQASTAKHSGSTRAANHHAAS